MDFRKALASGNLKEIRKIPKSDLHNHGMMGANRNRLSKELNVKLSNFTVKRGTIHEVNGWIKQNYRFLFDLPGAFQKTVEAAFIQAKEDGVRVLEMSIDLMLGSMFQKKPEDIISVFKHSHKSIAPEINFRPELGIARILPLRTILSLAEPYLTSGFFKSVDLYDDEFAQPVENYVELYRIFRNAGLKCKAHAGEFGDAETVRKTVELLELDAVQHGIAAASSPGIMKWIAERGTPLNVCPASNIRLKRARSYFTHPIRMLYDQGIKVTVNTDDRILFNAGVSEQLLRLHRCGLFSEAELDEIRMNGLS